jgi:hypothetical protein
MIAAAQQSYRLKVRVGDSEFDADGPEETVKAQFDLFLMALKYAAPSPRNTLGVNAAGGAGANPAPASPTENATIEDNTWGRFFLEEPDDHVSLKVLPESKNRNADAIMLLLYGYLKLRKKDTITASDLLTMANKSGLHLDRIDRCLPAGHRKFINRGGSHKGARYSLNNQGQLYAQQLLEAQAER